MELPVKRKKQVNKKKRKLKVSWINILLIGVCFYFVSVIFTQQQQISALDIKMKEVQQEKAEATEKELALAQDVENIENQEFFLQVVEKIARNEYKMVRPNEIIYIDKNKANNKFITGIGFDVE